jgi:hypothetical protein
MWDMLQAWKFKKCTDINTFGKMTRKIQLEAIGVGRILALKFTFNMEVAYKLPGLMWLSQNPWIEF